MKTIWSILFSVLVALLFSITIQAATLEGSLNRSLKGVKHWLSCHCYNGLIILTDKNILQPVCLEDNIETTCKSMRLTGSSRENISIPFPANPCIEEVRTIFFAESVECTQNE
jgi:hypothetical protein